jgi:signal transduction histidine kinase
VKNFTVRKVLGFIGPYPYNPYLIFLFFFALFFSRFVPVITDQPRGVARWVATLVLLLLSSIPSSLFAVFAYLIQKYRRWSSQSLTAYICEVALGQSIIFICAPLIRMTLVYFYDQKFEAPATFAPAPFIGSLFLALLSLGLMHQVERTIAGRLLLANEIVAKLEVDRAELIKADEANREQTSRFLHDSVQADLMIVGMKLKSISGKSTAEVNETVDRALSRLEKIRASDLRNLIQILTPNLDAGGLESALIVLFKQYGNKIEPFIDIDEATEALDSKVLLAIFRITEQALLNSLVHGPAKRVKVSVSTNSAGVTELIVSDDGPGVRIETTNAGVGTAIIDSWVGILNGSKEIDSEPGHGYQLRVAFPN